MSSSAAASPRVPPNFQTERVMPQASGAALDTSHAQQQPLGKLSASSVLMPCRSTHGIGMSYGDMTYSLALDIHEVVRTSTSPAA